MRVLELTWSKGPFEQGRRRAYEDTSKCGISVVGITCGLLMLLSCTLPHTGQISGIKAGSELRSYSLLKSCDILIRWRNEDESWRGLTSIDVHDMSNAQNLKLSSKFKSLNQFKDDMESWLLAERASDSWLWLTPSSRLSMRCQQSLHFLTAASIVC